MIKVKISSNKGDQGNHLWTTLFFETFVQQICDKKITFPLKYCFVWLNMMFKNNKIIVLIIDLIFISFLIDHGVRGIKPFELIMCKQLFIVW